MLVRCRLRRLPEKPLLKSTPRRALILIAASRVAAKVLDAADHESKASVANQCPLPEQLADVTIPDSDSLGAQEAGAAAIIDEGAAADSQLRRQVQRALVRLVSDRFADMSPPVRAAPLTDSMTASYELRHCVQVTEVLAVARFDAIRTGVVRELGHRGNTSLAEFRGCRYDEGA